MSEYQFPNHVMERFARHLRQEERSPGTVAKYLRDVSAFAHWLGSAPVTKELATGWKEHLRTQGYAPTTINSMLAAINGLFHFLGWDECRAGNRPRAGPGAAGSADGNHLRHRHPGQ